MEQGGREVDSGSESAGLTTIRRYLVLGQLGIGYLWSGMLGSYESGRIKVV